MSGLGARKRFEGESFGGKRRAYTMIELVIVFVILGILAAIVIPQITQASADAQRPNLAATIQTLRQQVQVYKLQHGNTLPNLTANWSALTNSTRGENAGQTFAPIMRDIPVNPENGNSNMIDSSAGPGATVAKCGFVYDFSGGSGQIYGTDSSGTIVLNY